AEPGSRRGIPLVAGWQGWPVDPRVVRVPAGFVIEGADRRLDAWSNPGEEPGGRVRPRAAARPARSPSRSLAGLAGLVAALLALLLALGRRGFLGGPLADLGLEIPFTTAAVVLAQTFVSAPFFIRSARTGIAAVESDLEDAARVDGASEAQVFRTITIPLAAP